MAYIGKAPAQIKRDLADKNTFTGDGSTTTFDLTNDALSDTTIQVFVDNVRQEPGSGKAFTLGEDGSGNLRRITFSAAPDASAEIYVINEGTRTSVLNTISDSAVTTAKLGTDAVTGAKLADDAVNSEHLTDGSVDNVHLAGSIADSKLATITTASKVNVSALSAPGSTSLFLRGDRSYAAIDVSGIDKNAFNISLLGFKMAVNEGLTVFNLVDGIVDEFHDESGTDEAEGSNDTYCASIDAYRNISFSPASVSAGFTMTTVTEADTSVAGTNPAHETGTPATFNAAEGLTGNLVISAWGAGGGGGYGGGATTPGGGGGFAQGTYAGVCGVLNVGVAEGGVGTATPTPVNTYALFGDHPEPTQSPLPAGTRGGGGAGTYAAGGGLSYITEEAALSQSSVPAIVIIAGGGGGGGGHQSSHGGTGGGSTGGDATGSNAGEGGSQTAGGTVVTGAQAGGLLYGGKAKGTQNGGGGGAGYYGGGGGGFPGSGPHGAGGGGSGYVGHPQMSSTSNPAGTASANAPGKPSPLYVACTAEGGAAPSSNGSGVAGEDGYILMTGTLSAIGTCASSTTVISTAFAAGTVPTTSRIVVFEEDEETPTINTDIIASISRDGGSNYTTATLTDSGYVTGASGQRILTGQATISGQPSGQSMRWKLALANNKVKIHGVSLQWA